MPRIMGIPGLNVTLALPRETVNETTKGSGNLLEDGMKARYDTHI